MSKYYLAIDQGTTSSRAILFDKTGNIFASASKEFRQIYPADAWVEHDPADIWQSTLSSCQLVLSENNICAEHIISIGITNQRETTLVWDKYTGKPVYNAIVWQDRRTASDCQHLKNTPRIAAQITYKTGLVIDPYFSASKISWILNNVEGAREKALQGQLCFGTVDTYLLWQLTQGKQFATDATNASRTMLFNIREQCWDEELLSLFDIPKIMLPEVKDSADDYGHTKALGNEIPINAMVGDQQAALIGQACFSRGATKSTYGTGGFIMVNTGEEVLTSKHQLLSTIGYRLNGQCTYALEGSIFMAGATMQWLRDGIAMLDNVADSEAMAQAVNKVNRVYLVPAFTGLGAPHWQPDARGAILGLTRDTGIQEIVTAALQSVAYQTKDLIHAMEQDGIAITHMRVDGGMVSNRWLMQFLADMLNITIERPQVSETTALGAAMLAGIQQGQFSGLTDAAQCWQANQTFSPVMNEYLREQQYQGWLAAIDKVLGQ